MPRFANEIDVTYIAAMLMVVGYSINDAGVVFDRLRENTMERKSRTQAEWRTLVNDELTHHVRGWPNSNATLRRL